ncbi:MAG: hypothetical protein ACO3HA_10620 [Burkholderiales bacterium]
MEKLNKNNDLIVFWTALLIAVLLLAGCDALGLGVTPIREVTTAPANFEGKEVRLKGRVLSVTKLPLLDMKAYTLRDDSGEITVLTQGELPAVNDTLGVSGKVSSAVIIGGQSLGLRVEEVRRF